MTEWLLPLTFAMIAAGAVIWLLDLLERKDDNNATLENMKQEADKLNGQLTVVKEEIVVHTELDKEIDKVLSLLTWNEGEGENN